MWHTHAYPSKPLLGRIKMLGFCQKQLNSSTRCRQTCRLFYQTPPVRWPYRTWRMLWMSLTAPTVWWMDFQFLLLYRLRRAAFYSQFAITNMWILEINKGYSDILFSLFSHPVFRGIRNRSSILFFQKNILVFTSCANLRKSRCRVTRFCREVISMPCPVVYLSSYVIYIYIEERFTDDIRC